MPGIMGSFIEFGRRQMGAATARHPAGARFRKLLAEICTVFGKTHGMVLDELATIVSADGEDEALAAVERLRRDPLAAGFRGEKLCDEFARLGGELSESVHEMEGVLPDEDVLNARAMVEQLMSREYQVAALYYETIEELSPLLTSGDAAPLEEIRQQARTAETELTAQLEAFRELAAAFRR